MITVQFHPYQGFFNEEQKQQIYNNASETIDAADADLQSKMKKLFEEFRRINREYSKLAMEQDRRDFKN